MSTPANETNGHLNTSAKGTPAFGIANSKFAGERRKLNALINDIRALGASVDVKLPRIAILGNQSAGKSSLIEAISGVRAAQRISPHRPTLTLAYRRSMFLEILEPVPGGSHSTQSSLRF